MSEDPVDRVLLPERSAVCSTYAGPKKGLGAATSGLYAWVGTYFSERASDVTVCFSDRAAAKAGPDDPVQVEVRFDLDQPFSGRVTLPDGLEIKRVPPEALVFQEFTGPLSEIREDIARWLRAMSEIHDITAGYRQRIVEMDDHPDSPGWIVEASVVLK